MVTLKEFSRRFGIDVSNTRRWLLRTGEQVGIEPMKARSSESKQMTLVWTDDDAARLLAIRQQKGFPIDGDVRHKVVPQTGQAGWFYAIRLAPDVAPQRLKFGFAIDVELRLSSHRCAAPTAELIRQWPCRQSWEAAALACVRAAESAKSISEEVFDVADQDALLERVETFFALLGSRD